MKAKGNEDVLAVQFLQRHPDALWQIIALSASASIGARGRSPPPGEAGAGPAAGAMRQLRARPRTGGAPPSSMHWGAPGTVGSVSVVGPGGGEESAAHASPRALRVRSARCAGALFISYTIKSFGALIFATIMTTRQFLSILLSCFLFLHPLSFGQL